MNVVDSVCTYCGVGCEITADIDNNKISKIYTRKEATVSKGKLCIKGYHGWDYLYKDNRVKHPLIKIDFIKKNSELFKNLDLSSLKKFNESYYKCDYNLAYDLASTKLKKILKDNSPYSYASLGGARTSCESSYLLQKFTREVIGSPNVDNCARICHSPSLKGMRTTIGEGAASNSFDDIYDSEFILVIGSNTTEAHPIVANRLLKAKKSGKINLATIDVREIQLSKNANYHMSIPYEANLLILNMLAYIIISEDLIDKDFIANRTNWYDEYKEGILNDEFANPEFIKKIAGYEHLYDTLHKVAREYASKKSMILWGLGITEHNDGSYAVMAITHLALLTGNIGKKGAGLIPLRGQNNVQGTCDMGMLPYYTPDYNQPKEIGLMTPDLIDAMLDNKIKALFVMGEDIAHIHPNLNKVHKALKKLDLIIVNEIFQNEVTKFADIIFGVKSAYEKEGVYINAERRAHLSTPLIESNLPDDWEVIQNIANRLNSKYSYKKSEDIWNEVRVVAKNRYSGAEYSKLKNNHLDGLQWPIGETGTKILHTKEFRTKDGIGRFEYHKYELRGQIKELIENGKYQNFYLTTGRILAHYNNVAQTGNCDKLIESHNQDIILYSIEDENIFKNREYVALKSKYGESSQLRLKASKTIKKGTLYTTFHHPKSNVNFLFGDEHDVLVKTANFKSVKVEIIE